MTESARSVEESLALDNLSLHELRRHLVDLTVEIADELVAESDYERMAALTFLYRTTLDALQRRHWSGR